MEELDIEYSIYGNIDNNDEYYLVKNDDKKYNIYNKYHGLVFDVWFDNIYNNINKDKFNDTYIIGYINNKVYKLYYLEGTFIFDKEI